ncbi:MAG: NTP transferase domain-containing protein [Spirochaetaceae bacterium]|jgi:spore coat polysaccharide biosynthesis protein SpsF|nr:NTP transferase domain-containing protein [Spirochaetaceae bacterium]
MTVLILQARVDSHRLPGKSLLPLGGEPLVFRVMEALGAVPCDLRVLACPEDAADFFLPLAKRGGFELYRGPKEDVLGRYCGAIGRFFPNPGGDSSRVIRATADNPFVFADAAAAIAQESAALGADYGGYAGLPLGAGVEAVSAAALLRAGEEADRGDEREHVCPYLYTHPNLFRLHRPLAPRPWQDNPLRPLRLTVDTPEDYHRAQDLYGNLLAAAKEERHLGRVIMEAADPPVRSAGGSAGGLRGTEPALYRFWE